MPHPQVQRKHPWHRAIALFLAVTSLLAVCVAQEKLDCPPQTIINNGVCISEKGNDCRTKLQPLTCYDPDPQYTDEAARANVKGILFLVATVGTDGCAHNIRVVSSLGFGLDDTAVSALERWRFRKIAKPMPISVEFNFDPKTSSRTPLSAQECATPVHQKPQPKE
jgi:TonB family protein